jgi:hypothetical protein
MDAPARLGGRFPVSIEVRPCRVAISSAAGALAAALLFAVQAPAIAQDADDRPWRGSIGLPDGPVAPLPPVVVPVDQGQSVDAVEPIGGEGLGGIGDDGPGASPPLERLGE